MVHDEVELLRWDAAMVELFGGQRVPMKPSRGRLFFTPSGMALVLERTKKPSAELREALTREGFFDKGITITVKDNDSMTPQPKPLERDIPSTLSREDRMFEYEVMQKLLGQLERLKEPPLRGLAITAAETALGRKLDDLRFGEGVQAIFEAVAPAPKKKVATLPRRRPTPDGPFFTEDEFYSMTRIGQMAGGYTAKTAGVAADTVAKRLGYSREQIRNEQLFGINQVAMRPDSSTGKKRQMVRFSMAFANKVIVELRVNPGLEPTLTQGIPTLSPFGGTSTGHPLLSRGPFDEDDATSRRS